MRDFHSSSQTGTTDPILNHHPTSNFGSFIHDDASELEHGKLQEDNPIGVCSTNQHVFGLMIKPPENPEPHGPTDDLSLPVLLPARFDGSTVYYAATESGK